MSDDRQPESARHGNSQPPPTDHTARDLPGNRRQRPRRWACISALAAVAACAAWAIGRDAAHRIESNDIEIAAQRQEPAPGFPKSSPTVDINNMIMRLGWVGNLDGTAVAYAAEADGLVTSNGRFRTDFSVDELAEILHLDPTEISQKDSPNAIDPHALLFRAQAGRLTAESKAAARKRRAEQVRERRPPDAASGNWDIREFSFTLERIKHPSAEERAVLAAICQAKLGIMPKPGDSMRAIAVNRGDLEPGKLAFAAGMLPPEKPMSTEATP
jgi:hypothetical protein